MGNCLGSNKLSRKEQRLKTLQNAPIDLNTVVSNEQSIGKVENEKTEKKNFTTNVTNVENNAAIKIQSIGRGYIDRIFADELRRKAFDEMNLYLSQLKDAMDLEIKKRKQRAEVLKQVRKLLFYLLTDEYFMYIIFLF
jgi:hypothetical protein